MLMDIHRKCALYVAVFLLTVSTSVVAEDEPQDESVPTEMVAVEVVSASAFNERVRRLPRLVEKIQIERIAADTPNVLLPHRPNYVLPFTYMQRINKQPLATLVDVAGLDENRVRDRNYDFDHIEAMFQFSIKYILADDVFGKFSRIEVGYTNRSFWQSYNSDISKPFRETNHEPELIISLSPEGHWFDRYSVAFNHQSNGQAMILSRSWNRIIAEATKVTSQGVWVSRVWWRIPEKKRTDQLDPMTDDNPGIEQYMGIGEIRYIYPMALHSFTVNVRNNFSPDQNRGSVELGWSFPMTTKVKGYVHYFDGYGDNMLDYNIYQRRFGIGVQLSDWF